MTGRSHNVAAQATTLGKRFATVADELLVALERLDDLLARYPLRGIKGPMGTSQDMLDLLGGSSDRLAELEQRVAGHLGFEQVLTSVGQVYPRSLDFDVVSALVQLAAGPSNLATTIRLMAGIELVTEGFKEGQVGSSAMPHKMNTRSCERVNGLAVVLRGQLSMVGELAGDQWNEGDVSCSVVRRVALPDAFFAADGLFQTFLTVLDEFGAFPAVVQRELDRYLPFLTTTKVLMAAVRNGVGREEAHEAIKEHAVAVALEMRQGRRRQRPLRPARRRPEARPRPGRPDRRAGAPTRSSSPARRVARSPPSYAGSRRRRPPTPRPRRTPPARSSEQVQHRVTWLVIRRGRRTTSRNEMWRPGIRDLVPNRTCCSSVMPQGRSGPAGSARRREHHMNFKSRASDGALLAITVATGRFCGPGCQAEPPTPPPRHANKAILKAFSRPGPSKSCRGVCRHCRHTPRPIPGPAPGIDVVVCRRAQHPSGTPDRGRDPPPLRQGA